MISGRVRYPQYSEQTHDLVVSSLMDRVMPVTESGCWIWMGEIRPDGYARMKTKWYRGESSHEYVHRVFYQLFKGPIPDGLEMDHLCRVRCCVNPEHLEAVTKQVNNFRGMSPPARHARQTHCHNGHALTPDNIYVTDKENGSGRLCRQCHKTRKQAYYERKKRLQETKA